MKTDIVLCIIGAPLVLGRILQGVNLIKSHRRRDEHPLITRCLGPGSGCEDD